MTAAVPVILGLLLVLLLLLTGAWFLKRMRDEQTQLLERVASLEADASRSRSEPPIPLLDEVSRAAANSAAGLKIGDPAPDVDFLDITGRTGRTASLARWRGQDTTVVFWDGASEECKQILPGLKAVEDRPRGVLPELLLVVPASSAGNQVVNLRSPIVIDRDGSAARAFGVDTWPSAVLVNARGEIGSQVATGAREASNLVSGRVPWQRGVMTWAGLEFEINRETRFPRAQTEALAETAAELGRERAVRVVADIGTGSGVIATFLARELPEAHIYGVDVSAEGLATAQRNLERHGVADRVTLLEGSLLEPVPEEPDLITTDISYLSDDILKSAGRRLLVESPNALHGGPTGLELYGQLFKQISGRGWNATLVLEIYPSQEEEMRKLLHATLGPGDVEIQPAYLGNASVVVFIPETASEVAARGPGKRSELEN